jgi:hypothetical protein
MFCLCEVQKILIMGMCLISQASGQDRTLRRINNSSISGTVRNQNDVPLLSQVTVLELKVNDGTSIPIVRCNTQTDFGGAYTCRSLPHGHYIVIAQSTQSPHLDYGKLDAKIPDVYPATFYPNSKIIEDALTIDLHDGENFSADLRLLPSPAVVVSGSLPSSAKTATVVVSLDLNGNSIGSGLSVHFEPKLGKFKIPSISDGKYQISAKWTVDGLEHRGSVIAALGPSFSSSVTVSENFSARVDGAIRLNSPSPIKFPTLVALERNENGNAEHYTTRIRNDGSFTFLSMQPGKYMVRLLNSGSMYVHGVFAQGKELSDQTILIATDTRMMSLEIGVSINGASISGSIAQSDVTDENTGVVIQDVQTGETIVAKVDANRSFLITGLAPGEYRLFAWPSVNDVPYKDPQFLRRYADQSETISVEEGKASTQIEVPLITNFN